MLRIYVASSWRNMYQPQVVDDLRHAGFSVYDFRQRVEGDHDFRWLDINPAWQSWTPADHRAALTHPVAEQHFARDACALKTADVTVLVLPCGRSAHLELGYAIGQGQPTAILIREPSEPELMTKLAARLCFSMAELLDWLSTLSQPHD